MVEVYQHIIMYRTVATHKKLLNRSLPVIKIMYSTLAIHSLPHPPGTSFLSILKVVSDTSYEAVQFCALNKACIAQKSFFTWQNFFEQ